MTGPDLSDPGLGGFGRRGRYRPDRGSVSIYAVLFFFPLLMAAGLVLDGGAKVEAIGQARDLADNAARVAAQNVATGGYRAAGAPPVDYASSADAAEAYLASTPGRLVDVSFPDSDVVVVTVEIDVDYLLLPGSTTVRSFGSAVIEQG